MIRKKATYSSMVFCFKADQTKTKCKSIRKIIVHLG